MFFHRKVKPRTFILADIDGVLNPLGVVDDTQCEFVQDEYAEWWLNYNFHKPMLEELHKLGTIVWASNWGPQSNAAGRFYELPEFTHVPLRNSNTTIEFPDTWKMEAIEEWFTANVRPGDKVVWIDDEIGKDALQWSHGQENTLFVPVDPYIGYTECNHTQVTRFLTDTRSTF